MRALGQVNKKRAALDGHLHLFLVQELHGDRLAGTWIGHQASAALTVIGQTVNVASRLSVPAKPFIDSTARTVTGRAGRPR